MFHIDGLSADTLLTDVDAHIRSLRYTEVDSISAVFEYLQISNSLDESCIALTYGTVKQEPLGVRSFGAALHN